MLQFSFFALAAAATLAKAEGPTYSVHGSGTTNPTKCYWHIMEKMRIRSKLPLHLTYRAVGSSTGQVEFSQNDPVISDFGSGDIPLSAETYGSLTAAGDTILQLPVFVGAVSFYHSIPNTPTLNLTACTLARIMKQEIKEWNHDDIISQNPTLELPEPGLPIKVARRVRGSSSTSVVTQVGTFSLRTRAKILVHSMDW